MRVVRDRKLPTSLSVNKEQVTLTMKTYEASGLQEALKNFLSCFTSTANEQYFLD
jgi:hypothetical protein